MSHVCTSPFFGSQRCFCVKTQYIIICMLPYKCPSSSLGAVFQNDWKSIELLSLSYKMPSIWISWPVSSSSCLILLYSFIRSLRINLCCSSWSLTLDELQQALNWQQLHYSLTLSQSSRMYPSSWPHFEHCCILIAENVFKAVLTIWAQYGILQQCRIYVSQAPS